MVTVRALFVQESSFYWNVNWNYNVHINQTCIKSVRTRLFPRAPVVGCGYACSTRIWPSFTTYLMVYHNRHCSRSFSSSDYMILLHLISLLGRSSSSTHAICSSVYECLRWPKLLASVGFGPLARCCRLRLWAPDGSSPSGSSRGQFCNTPS